MAKLPLKDSKKAQFIKKEKNAKISKDVSAFSRKSSTFYKGRKADNKHPSPSAPIKKLVKLSANHAQRS